MACFLGMEPSAIRVQLPGGDAFIPAFAEAAEKYAMRHGFSDDGATRLGAIVGACATFVVSAGCSTIELIIDDDDGTVAVELQGEGATGPAPTDTADRLSSLGVDRLTVDRSRPAVQFRVDID